MSDNETIPPFFSNKDGLARCMNNNPGYTDYYKVEHEDDSLLVIDSSYGRDVRDEGIKNHAVLFTDRSIYRPGQTGYFKAILFETSKSNQKKLLTGTSVNMRLLDGNWQVIWEKSFVTNEFGSINGSFDIPQHLLNGRMILECDRYGHEEIRVEEYKRPTFTVTFDPVGGNIRLNEKAKVTANVKALAGYTVDHADVRYRVVRHIHSYSYYVGRLYLPYRQMQREVGSGIMTTDDNGNFSVEFETWADDTQDDRKVYTYYVTADVTDVNGETRSASVDVHVGNYPLLINTNLTDQILVGQLNDYTIETTNLNGDFTPAAVKVEIVRLKSPEKILRKRIWEDQVDLQAISEDEFRRDFPFDAYGDELNPSVLEDLEIVAQYDIHVDAKKKLDFSSLQHPGYYRIKLVADNQLGVVTDKTLYTYLAGDRSVPIPDMTKWLTVVKNSGEPGEQVEIHIAGGEENTSLYYELIHRNRIVESKWMKVGKKPEKICYTIKEEHRGGFDLQFNMVRHNRLYSENVKITVPFTDKMLDVNLVTFRDQLLPGQNETWTMKVSNKQGRGELAEIVASLYDASLDQIRPHHWIEMSSVYSQENFFWWPYGWNFEVINNLAKVRANAVNLPQQKARPASFTDINWFDDYWYAIAVHSGHGYVTYHSEEKADLAVSEDYDFDVDYDLPPPPPPPEPEPGTLGREMIHAKGGVREDNRDLVQIVARNNFDETAFFYPALRTNEKGEALIEFTMPEALTRWKLLSFAHTKDLKIGTYSNELVTRKQVAISANPPRFFRESDVIELTAKVNNLTDDELDGQALLRLYDAATMQSIDTFIRSEKTPRFRMNAGGSTGLRWTLTIPEGIQAIVYKVTVQSGMHTDGEEKTIPVLKNSILVTETLPFTVRAGKEKTLNFDHFVNNQSNTLRNHSLTLEYTSAPAWYAVQALPYLMEYPYECAEQTFSRYYANALASAVLDKTPRIRAIFDRWGKQGSEAFMSDLEKNRELKQVMLEEAPWVLQAKSESERKKRVGLLFEFNRMGSEQSRVFGLLRKMQNEDDGFPWFKNNPSNRFITQQIVSGMAHLEKLGAIQLDRYGSIGKMARRSLRYLDAEIRKDYNALVKNKVDLEKKHVGSIQLHYLYACSFTGHQPKNGDEMEAFDYYLQQAGQFWKEFTTYEKAMTALILHRNDQPEKAMEIIRSLKEYAQQSEEMGMYWKDNVAGYWWYQAPIETQAMLIEAFNEVAKDEEAVEEMKIWLLRNKQTNDWKTTKATSEAIYALLMTGGSLLDE
ncbi:MAG: hypothetical protein LBV74_22885, partial [Tannerella sp.]|nr:hypothetical protein [Tannerella sp.]